MEIGVHRGNFSAKILSVAAPRKLHLVDPWLFRDEPAYSRALYGRAGALEGQKTVDERYQAVEERFAEAISAGRVMVHRARSAEVLGQFADNSLDWIYIDGDHTFEAVRIDLDLAYRKVRPGGFIFGDDYGKSGWWDNGVTKALHQFLVESDEQLFFLHGSQFAVRRSESIVAQAGASQAR